MNYEIKGGSMPVLELMLAPGETINCEHGGMSWMSPNMQMKTTGGGLGKMFTKALTGESMFSNTYTAGNGMPGMIAVSTNFPGSIVAIEIAPGREIICQKSAYLASTPGVELSIHFQKKLGAGFFGGEGFIMQKISGQGMVFLEIDGTAINYQLGAGQQMILDTGYLAVMDATCTMDIQTVQGGVKNMMLGGEGFFNTVVTGPGNVTVQTMPKSAVSAALFGYGPASK